MTNADPNTRIKVTVDRQLKEPSLFKLIYVNDNETAMEFVIKTLTEIFHYKTDTAESIMLDIHEKGSAVVAVLPYEMAEQKGVEVTVMARGAGFPLQVKLEPDV
jgi:ATP-dependent Clp protease adaptor protein ClpS